jgi:hypothetical protein
MNQLLMNIGCSSCWGPWDDCYELRVSACERSAAYSGFELLLMVSHVQHLVYTGMDITAAEMEDIRIYYANYTTQSESWCT